MIIIGLGGNVGGEEAVRTRFVRAREAIEALGPVRSAALYRTAPIGPAQPPYVNTAVALVAPEMQPTELIAILQELERLSGRDRGREERWGPRTLDLDVLLWGERVLHVPGLDVPHPRLGARRFALAPLVDLVGPEAIIPGVGRAGEALARVRDQAVEPISATW